MAVFSLPESATHAPTQTVPIADVLARIRAEYAEMPGLKLTAPQARRLWALDCVTCDAALAALVNAKFLSRTPEGLFVIATSHGPEQMPRRGFGTHSPVPSRRRQAIWSGNLPPSRKSA
jgi:hypothetical protein